MQPVNASEHPVKTKDRSETFVARNAQGSSKRHCETNALVASHLTEFSLKIMCKSKILPYGHPCSMGHAGR